MLKNLGRSRPFQRIAGFLAGEYLALVCATTRIVDEPANLRAILQAEWPMIIAMWHGQHFLLHAAMPDDAAVSALVSRHGDGEINARALKRIGIAPIRGSGGPAEKMRRRGGSVALREMVRALATRRTVAITADVPKRARVAGPGIVALAQISARPIFPLAVASRPRIDFATWDRASLGLPFGRGALVLGAPIRVARDAGAAELEKARCAVQFGLDEAHRRAYELIGATDPGAMLSRTPR